MLKYIFAGLFGLSVLLATSPAKAQAPICGEREQIITLNRVETMADKFIYIPNNDSQNYPFCRLKRLDTQRNEPTNQNLVEVPNIVEIVRKKELV